jgi:protein N-terminal amidase
MDLNPKNFTEPWDKYEFANHVLNNQSDLVLMPMAWLTMQPPSSIIDQAQVPDADTLAYWIQRLQPIIDQGGTGSSQETIFVACNRTGIEGTATYAGTSVVIGITRGNVRVYGCLGRGTEDLLVCDVPTLGFPGMLPGTATRRR